MTEDYEWKCCNCNYKMDSVSCVTQPEAEPAEDDLTMCLNCGHLYVRHDNKWTEITPAEYDGIDYPLKLQIEACRLARAEVVTKSLVRSDAWKRTTKPT